MRRLPLLLVLGVVLALAPAGAAYEQRETAGKARLSLVRGTPLTVRGVGFVRGERVRVRVSAGRQYAKRVTADEAGRFLVRFGTSFDRCLGLTAYAVGSEGSRAGLKTPELLCPPRL